VPISVNISANNLLDSGFVDKVHAVLDSLAVEPALLEFEVTESAVMRHPDTLLKRLGEIRALCRGNRGPLARARGPLGTAALGLRRAGLSLAQPLVEELASPVEAEAAANRAQHHRRADPDALADGPADAAGEKGAEGAEDSAHQA
jgi:hypothetical protein